MKINADKASFDNQNLVMVGEEVETDNNFYYLRAVFSDTNDDMKQIKRKTAFAKIAVSFISKDLKE